MSRRHLIGFSKANRAAAGVDTGHLVEVEVELDTEPRVIAEPDDLTRALDADPEARAAWDGLAPSHRRRHLHAIEGAKKLQPHREHLIPRGRKGEIPWVFSRTPRLLDPLPR